MRERFLASTLVPVPLTVLALVVGFALEFSGKNRNSGPGALLVVVGFLAMLAYYLVWPRRRRKTSLDMSVEPPPHPVIRESLSDRTHFRDGPLGPVIRGRIDQFSSPAALLRLQGLGDSLIRDLCSCGFQVHEVNQHG